MATEVKVPSVGESISSGILATWHVKEGDYVQAGQVLYDLETDKITSEGQAECAGIIQLKANAGDEVEIGSVIAIIDESAAKPDTAQSKAAEAKKESKPIESKSAESKAPESKPSATSAPAPAKAEPKNMPISPGVRRMAAEANIDPSSIPGTGKDGRVTKGDLLSAPQEGPLPAHGKQIERTTRIKMTPMRRKIAERLVASSQETAMLTTFNEVDMSPVMNLRKKHQDSFVERYGIKLGFMSFFVKAAVKALKEVPGINAQIDGDSVIQNHFYDISIAVGGPKGLVVPVLRDCDQLSFAQIEQSILDYAKKARDGKLGIEDMTGGCFTISNGGIYGSMLSTPIINPPQSAILGMHNIKDRAVVVNNEIVIRPMMYLALSYDHRLVDGKEAVTFLNSIREALEDPTRLLFEI